MADKQNKGLLEYDLLDLPLIRNLSRRWFRFRISGDKGNSTRALLFLDLAEATRLNTPLDRALELIAESQERMAATKSSRLGIVWSSFSRTEFPDPERLVKRLALYLLPWVRQGLSLSEAMARLGRVFSRQEILIVEMGEKSGMLPQALKRLGDYRQADMRLQTVRAYLMYPVTVVIVATMVISFVLTFILPKFQDIYAQLGGETPGLTQIIINASAFFAHHVPDALLFLLLFFLLARLTGSIVNRTTGVPLSHYLPVFSGLYRTVREARWMTAFALGLEAGLTADQALEHAGGISGGVLEKRSREAAQLVQSGCAIGEACIRCKVLDGWINHRLQLIDWRGNYIEGLRAIVEDADRRLVDTIGSLGQRLEVISIVTLGAIVGVTVIGVYLPLLNVTKVVGW